MNQFNAIFAIAFRDFTKLLRDKPRLLVSFVFPVLFIGALGGSLQSGFGDAIGYDLITFIFTGVLAQNLFQSTASGVISLIEDRENDFSQEIFVSPISRYSIIIGKILGETLVSMVLGLGIIVFGFIVGVPLTFAILLKLIPVALIACFFGGAFGVIVLSNLSSQRTANQIFPLIIFPQFILAGVFNPIKDLPVFLDVLSRISPMRYAVDLMRGVYYAGTPEYDLVVLSPVLYNLTVIAVVFVLFLLIGTTLFVKNERNR
ncbi:ABC transporter [candidate division WWE3 bacterium CG_4_9_14_3_um_filter_41_6]|uniref:Transport permease protein n=1 Tax=candidate division WWE3 bacterium CG_4_10_14_0_2_um_filter_41_14 TaxID=1975072 RepID=A0A2M7TJG7_UNCKA|nr:MAG: ABC transporter [candidate division WWE3 bacterium CG_4_10_14_0_2_um_filter_41_14]PJA38811.1 MAG: ABC transporter [candidate division WWE3 bacterium CG_4_9_14_3_um_filter_41_6]